MSLFYEPSKMTVLIVEDEASIAESLQFSIASEGFRAEWKPTAAEALVFAQQQQVHFVIMDVGLPDMSGFEACKQLREFCQAPLMFLTARGDEIDRVVGLEIGGDDYVVKPFSPREVIARVKTILKRVYTPSGAFNEEQRNVHFFGNNPDPQPLGTSITHRVSEHPTSEAGSPFVVFDESKSIRLYDNELTLTPIEYKLLAVLIQAKGNVLSRDQLLDAAGTSQDAGYERTIDGHIKTLRAKLREANQLCIASGKLEKPVDWIKTARGFGYALNIGATND